MTASSLGSASGSIHRLLKPIVLLLVVTVILLAYFRFGDQVTFENLASYEAKLRAYERSNSAIVYGGAFLLYTVVSGLSIPGGAVVLSMTYGSYFGWLRAVVLVSFASTLGATIAFLTSRYLFRDFVQRKFGKRLNAIDDKLQEEGAFYLFSLRLIVAVPFSILNLVMGLTKMKTATFWWVSQLGMLAGTAAYVYAGSTVKPAQLAENGFRGLGWEFALALAILGIMPIAVKKLLGVFRRGQTVRPTG